MDIEFKTSKKPVNYKKALHFLKKRVEKVKKGERELVWFLEHPITYTAGIRSKREEILDKSINIIKTNRGGKITLHNPGQQIVYFVINLNKRKKDIRNLVRQIENTIIKFLKILIFSSERKNENNITDLARRYLPKYLFRQKTSFELAVARADLNKIRVINNLLQKAELYLRKNDSRFLIIIQRFLLNFSKTIK